jgi:TonB family protein
VSIATWGETLEHKPPRAAFPAYVVSLAFHVGIVALLITGLMRSSGGSGGGATPSQPHGIGAFVSVSTVAPAAVAPPRPAAKMAVTRDKTPVASGAPQQSGSSAPGAGGNGSGAGPIRIGTGEGLGVISKVQPIYPRIMEIARTPGTVVVDAVVLRDGTIGDIKVLSSTGPLFEKAAIEALKRWRYAPLAQDVIITVTVNFVLHS